MDEACSVVIGGGFHAGYCPGPVLGVKASGNRLSVLNASC